MTQTVDVAMAAPASYDGAPLPKRGGPKGLMPSTWIGRCLQVEYVVCGELRQTEGTLLDLYPAGSIMNIGGHKTLLSWDTLAVVELVGA